MPIKILTNLCRGCGACAGVCPHHAIFIRSKQAMVDNTKCHECEECVFNCPNGAITCVARVEPEVEPPHC